MAHRNKSSCALEHGVAIAFATKEGGDLSVMMPADCLDTLISALTRARSAVMSKQTEQSHRISVTVPKTWMVTAENERGAVLVIFDPKTDTQAGYALDVEASKKMAAGLVQNAEAISILPLFDHRWRRPIGRHRAIQNHYRGAGPANGAWSDGGTRR